MSGRIIVHSLDHARAAVAAAAALGVPVTLASAPGAGGYAGPPWFEALVAAAAAAHPEVRVEAVLDCGEEAGTVLAALRTGLKRLRFAGPPDLRDRLATIAAAQGAVIEDGTALAPALDLLDQPRPEARCQEFLARFGHGDPLPTVS